MWYDEGEKEEERGMNAGNGSHWKLLEVLEASGSFWKAVDFPLTDLLEPSGQGLVKVNAMSLSSFFLLSTTAAWIISRLVPSVAGVVPSAIFPYQLDEVQVYV